MSVLAAIPPGPHAGRVWHDPVASRPALLPGCTVRQLTNYRGHSHHLVGASPCWLDGGRRLVVVSDREGCGNLFAYDFADGSLTQLTDLRGAERPVAVAPAARDRLRFHYGAAAYELDSASLWLRPLNARTARGYAAIAASLQQPETGEIVGLDGLRLVWLGSTHTPLAETGGRGREPFAVTAPCVSPDGRRVVFVSDAGGYAQVYVVELPVERPTG